MEELTAHLQRREDLKREQVRAAAEGLLGDRASDASKAAFLRALADKGETPEEIAAFVEAFLERAIDPGIPREAEGGPLLDVCGTGGDKLNLFNISTATIFILAAAGIRVVKHGNRGITSKSGGADVLEALGVRIDRTPEDLAACVAATGVGFLFAPHYHPAFKAVAPVRQMLAAEGRRSIFNILGPLLNPARPDYQMIGVFDKALTPVFARILASLGRRGGWVVHGTADGGAGMDEMSTLGPTTISALEAGGSIREEVFDPTSLPGLAPASLADLRGGEAAENALILEEILRGGTRGPKRDIVLLNAAAGLVIAGVAENLAAGFLLAGTLVDEGEAVARLEALRGFGG